MKLALWWVWITFCALWVWYDQEILGRKQWFSWETVVIAFGVLAVIDVAKWVYQQSRRKP